jgi:hypothetical protein
LTQVVSPPNEIVRKENTAYCGRLFLNSLGFASITEEAVEADWVGAQSLDMPKYAKMMES